VSINATFFALTFHEARGNANGGAPEELIPTFWFCTAHSDDPYVHANFSSC
jgi:hypothetical protein